MQDGALQLLLDEAACTRLLMAYGRAADWQDGEALEALFWPDAHIDLGFFKGSGANLPAFMMKNAALSERRFHLTANVHTQVDADMATSDSYAITHAVGADSNGGQVRQIFFGRYLDRFERRNGAWRISERIYILHGHEIAPYQEAGFLDGVLRAEGFGPGHPYFELA